jgi:hypothetical protein
MRQEFQSFGAYSCTLVSNENGRCRQFWDLTSSCMYQRGAYTSATAWAYVSLVCEIITSLPVEVSGLFTNVATDIFSYRCKCYLFLGHLAECSGILVGSNVSFKEIGATVYKLQSVWKEDELLPVSVQDSASPWPVRSRRGLGTEPKFNQNRHLSCPWSLCSHTSCSDFHILTVNSCKWIYGEKLKSVNIVT